MVLVSIEYANKYPAGRAVSFSCGAVVGQVRSRVVVMLEPETQRTPFARATTSCCQAAPAKRLLHPLLLVKDLRALIALKAPAGLTTARKELRTDQMETRPLGRQLGRNWSTPKWILSIRRCLQQHKGTRPPDQSSAFLQLCWCLRIVQLPGSLRARAALSLRRLASEWIALAEGLASSSPQPLRCACRLATPTMTKLARAQLKPLFLSA